MYKSHYYTLNKACPCKIGEATLRKTIDIYGMSVNIASFVAELEQQRIIGKKIWFDETENTIFITKVSACSSGGGCPSNKNIIGERCHCDHYNYSKEHYPKYYCKCGAEFYRPMFAPIFGDDISIEPYKTVLSGDEECILAIKIGKTEV